jgi:carboxyl-terminal processing protease
MKFRTGLLLGGAFAVGLVAGPLVREVAPRFGFPVARAEDTPPEGDVAYHALTLFGNVYERVRQDYVEPVKDQQLIENSLDGMLSGLDPHSSYMNPKQWADFQVTTKGVFGGLGLEVTSDQGLVKVVSPIDDTPAARAGMKSGDLVLSLDHKTLEGISLNDAVDKMRGAPGTDITLTVKREHIDKPFDVKLTRDLVHVQVVKSTVYGNIGYIRLPGFNEESGAKLREAIDRVKAGTHGNLAGVILDLRNNPGGLLDQAEDICDDFIADGAIVSTRARHADENQTAFAKGTDLIEGLPLVVLINGGSASASEIVAGALQDHRRAVILGSRSFGKGSVQTVIPLGTDGAMRLTTARYFTPSGRSIQGLGIAPDVEVAESHEDEVHYLPDREADMVHALKLEGSSQPTKPAAPRDDLPAQAKQIPAKPPASWPKFDLTKPETDFQLQQGLTLVRAMAQQRHAAR